MTTITTDHRLDQMSSSTSTSTVLPTLRPVGQRSLASLAGHAPHTSTVSHNPSIVSHTDNPHIEETPSRPLKVCHVSLTLKTGGLERLLVDFARRHDHDRAELTFLAMREIGPFAEYIRETAVKSIN